MSKRSVKSSEEIDLSGTPELGEAFFKRARFANLSADMAKNCNVVRIAPDLRKDFPNEASVNEALRLLKRLRTLDTLNKKRTTKKKSA